MCQEEEGSLRPWLLVGQLHLAASPGAVGAYSKSCLSSQLTKTAHVPSGSKQASGKGRETA